MLTASLPSKTGDHLSVAMRIEEDEKNTIRSDSSPLKNRALSEHSFPFPQEDFTSPWRSPSSSLRSIGSSSIGSSSIGSSILSGSSSSILSSSSSRGSNSGQATRAHRAEHPLILAELTRYWRSFREDSFAQICCCIADAQEPALYERGQAVPWAAFTSLKAIHRSWQVLAHQWIYDACHQEYWWCSDAAERSVWLLRLYLLALHVDERVQLTESSLALLVLGCIALAAPGQQRWLPHELKVTAGLKYVVETTSSYGSINKRRPASSPLSPAAPVLPIATAIAHTKEMILSRINSRGCILPRRAGYLVGQPFCEREFSSPWRSPVEWLVVFLRVSCHDEDTRTLRNIHYEIYRDVSQQLWALCLHPEPATVPQAAQRALALLLLHPRAVYLRLPTLAALCRPIGLTILHMVTVTLYLRRLRFELSLDPVVRAALAAVQLTTDEKDDDEYQVL